MMCSYKVGCEGFLSRLSRETWLQGAASPLFGSMAMNASRFFAYGLSTNLLSSTMSTYSDTAHSFIAGAATGAVGTVTGGCSWRAVQGSDST